MRKLASEIIRDLEVRIARLERQASRTKKADFDPESDRYTTAYEDELQTLDIFQSVIKGRPQNTDLKVFLKCLSLNRAHNLALKLSRTLKVNNWESDKNILKIALMMKLKRGLQGLGRVFTMYALKNKSRLLLKALKSAGLLAKSFDLNNILEFSQLLLPDGLETIKEKWDISWEELKEIESFEEDMKRYIRSEADGDLVIDTGVNFDLYAEWITERFILELDDYLDSAENDKSNPLFWFFYDVIHSIEIRGDIEDPMVSIHGVSKTKLLGSYHSKFNDIEDVDYWDSWYGP